MTIDREPVTEGAEPEPELSLDDILSAGLNEAHDALEEREGPEPAAGTQAERDRDEQGRFKAREAEKAAAAAAPAKTDPKITDQGTKPADGAASAQAASPSDAPASWSAAAKAHWKTLPPDVQAEAHRREAEFAKGIEQKSQGYQALESVIGPKRQMLQQVYGSVENGITELLGLSDFAVTKPNDFVKWFVHQHRLNPQEIFAMPAAGAQPGNGQQPGEAAQPALPPEIAAAVDRVERSQQQFVETYVNGPIKAKARSELQQFEADASTKYPHYTNPQVKQAMEAALLSGPDTMTFEDAYDRVIWSMPELRSQLLEAERKAAVEAKAKEAADAAAKARVKTGARFSPAGTPAKVRTAAMSIDQTMNEAYDRVNGG